jgi:hypothetical protein
MRRIVWIVPWLLLFCFSCTGRDQAVVPPETTTEESTGLRLVINDADHSMTVSRPADRELLIRCDGASRVQYLDCGDFHVQGGPGWFLEWTSRDYLAVEFEDLGGGRRIERYDFNGRTLELEIYGQPTEAQYQEFLAFYEPDPEFNSLEDNPDGAAMAELLDAAGPLFLEAWQTRDPESYKDYVGSFDKNTGLPPLEMRPKWADRTCGAASLCAAIKCTFGGLTNHGCVICTVVKTACLIMDMFGWW